MQIVVVALACGYGGLRGVRAACITEPPQDVSYSWPRLIAAPLAAARLTWQYAPLNEPVFVDHAGRSLVIGLPEEYAGGSFQIANGDEDVPVETYHLKSIEVHSPGLHGDAESAEKAAPLELWLIHQEQLRNGLPGRLAVIAVPMTEGVVTRDPLLPLIQGAQLPETRGARGRALLNGGGKNSLDLGSLLPKNDASLLHFWGKMVSRPCGPGEVATRHLVHPEPIAVEAETLQKLQEVLQQTVVVDETGAGVSSTAPMNVWRIPVCQAGATCQPMPAQGTGIKAVMTATAGRLLNATQDRNKVRALLTQRRTELNKSLDALQAVRAKANESANAIRNPTVDGAELVAAAKAAQALHSAEEEMNEAREQALEASVNSAAVLNLSKTWDDGNPGNPKVPVTVTLGGAGGSDENSTSAVANASLLSLASQTEATSLLNLFIGDKEEEEVAQETDSDVGLVSCHTSPTASPINISTADIADLTALTQASDQLLFAYDKGLSELVRCRMRLENVGRAMRLEALPGDGAAPGGLSGHVSVKNGSDIYDLASVEMKVPGEHAIDGVLPAAELQFLHKRRGGTASEPVLAVALRLEQAEGAENTWLGPLANFLPVRGETTEAYGSPLWLVADSLAPGKQNNYFRYDGTTTTPPCKAARWIVLSEPGFVSPEQLSAMQLALPPTGRPARYSPMGERIVVRNSFMPLEKKGARAILAALQQRRHLRRQTQCLNGDCSDVKGLLSLTALPNPR